MRISDWSSDVCSSDLAAGQLQRVVASGVTPLLLLLGARAEPGTACDEDVVMAALDHLLDEEVSLDAQDPRGFGPLHLAALHGQLRMTQRLLRAGCDPDLRDALNRTPREIRSAEHTSELQSLMRISYAVFCLKT